MRKSSPKYTRRHYVDIADTLTHILGEDERWEQALLWSRKFAEDNPRFKQDRFLTACGLKRTP